MSDVIETTEAPERVVPRGPTSLQLANYYSARYAFHAPVGTAPSDPLNPGYWAHVAKRLRPWDEIVVIPEDGSWRAVYFVRAVGRAEAAVAMIECREFGTGAEISKTDIPYYVKWGGPSVKHRVHRKDTNDVVKDGFQTAEQAQLWISNHIRATA